MSANCMRKKSCEMFTYVPVSSVHYFSAAVHRTVYKQLRLSGILFTLSFLIGLFALCSFSS